VGVQASLCLRGDPRSGDSRGLADVLTLVRGPDVSATPHGVTDRDQEAAPKAVGTTQTLERWVEFAQAGSVKGREVVSIVPQAEIQMVVKDAPPAANGSKVQVLRGNEYVRVWINKGGNHYLIHLPASGATPGQ